MAPTTNDLAWIVAGLLLYGALFFAAGATLVYVVRRRPPAPRLPQDPVTMAALVELKHRHNKEFLGLIAAEEQRARR